MGNQLYENIFKLIISVSGASLLKKSDALGKVALALSSGKFRNYLERIPKLAAFYPLMS